MSVSKVRGYRPNIDCIYLSSNCLCGHLDMGRGFLFLGKECVLKGDFADSCRKQVEKRPLGDPPQGSGVGQ